MLIVVFFASLDMTGFTFRSAPIPSANILRLKTLIRGLSVTTETKATKNHWPPKATPLRNYPKHLYHAARK